jgi:dihydrofolate reductase
VRISIVVAVAENGVIGRNGGLPWRLPADLKRFRETTWGAPMILGRSTYESIGRPLPGRTSYVLSTRREWIPPGPPDSVANRVRVVRSFEEAVAACAAAPEAFVVGGEAVYREALPRADRLYITRVRGAMDGDVRFPIDEIESRGEWRRISTERRARDAENPFDLDFEIWDRTTNTADAEGSSR